MMAELNGFIEKKDDMGRVIERGMYRHGHRIGEFRIVDFDRGLIIDAHYSDQGTERILDCTTYAMVQDRAGNCVHKGDKLQAYVANPDGTLTVKTYTYRAGYRNPMVKTDILKSSEIYLKKSRSGR